VDYHDIPYNVKDMSFTRKLALQSALERKSVILLGPRSVGKSWLWNETLSPDRSYNLLETKTLRRLTQNPGLIFDECLKRKELVVIDEVQKIPELLNEVHRAIEEKETKFLLSGSSARKLKRNETGLLGGRATSLELYPLSWVEIPDFDLVRYINHGGIPRHYLTEQKFIENELEDYVSLYLKEEIKNEAITRNLDGFSRFLEVMALHCGDEVVYDNFANDAGLKPSTFRNYVDVLKDTLIGFEVPAFTKTVKRKAITRSKFFLFDVGIARYIRTEVNLQPKTPAFGKAFEHWIALELRAYLSYNRKKEKLSYWRSTSQFEVDFLLGSHTAIEVKATNNVTEKMLTGLKRLREEKIFKNYILVSLEEFPRKSDGIEILPYQNFMERLWDDGF